VKLQPHPVLCSMASPTEAPNSCFDSAGLASLRACVLSVLAGITATPDNGAPNGV